MLRPLRLLLLAVFVGLPALSAQEHIDSTAIVFFKAEAIERGQVMAHAEYLTDVNGPRLTASPGLHAAEAWAVGQFQGWGLKAAREPWGSFGRGWELQHFALNARVAGSGLAAHAFPVVAYPKAWSPGTGRRTAELVLFDATDESQYERFRGQLRGKLVLLTTDVAPVDQGSDAISSRHDDARLLELANAGSDGVAARRYNAAQMQRFMAAQRKLAFVAGEQPLAILESSQVGGHGTIRVMGATVPSTQAGSPFAQRPRAWTPGVEVVPQFVVLNEHYNRLLRLLQRGHRVTMDLDFQARYLDDDPTETNVIADIPGTDPALKDEVVIVGAHIDSWHSATGATDNAAGTAAVMEVARVLNAYYQQRGQGPRRTVRFALWTGEEQGLYGAINYVKQHYATLDDNLQTTATLPDHDKVSAYFNMDNGSGRLRGIYMQQNDGVRPIFRAWLNAFGDSTAQTLTLTNTSGTDHIAFDAAGLPGFQFIQDPLAYFAHTWHTTSDTYDHLVPDDLKQAAALISTFAHHAAERDEKLPRKPLRLAGEAVGSR